MNRSLRPLLIPLTLLVSSTAALAEPLTATYIGTPNGRHGYAAVQRFTLTVDPLMVPFSAEPDWWEIAFILEDATLAVRARSAAVPMLAPGGPSPEIERYQFRGRDGGAFEYVHALTGEALLPSFDFQLSFLPRAATRSSVDEYGFARSGTLLGHAYLLEKVEMAAAPLEPWEDAVRLELNPDLLVGTARSFRDVTLGRIPGPEDYEYVAFVESEYDEMVAAGINFAVVSPAQKPWVQKRSIFYCSWHPEFPDDFYRSNYFGWAYCMDEPAVLLYEDRTVGDHIRDVRDVATAMRARAKAEYHLVSGAGDLIRFGQGGAIGGVNADPLRLVQSSVPYWDTIVSAAYYELAEGGGGVLHEGRYDLPAEQALWDAVFGPGIALATDEALLINYAFLRGAARNFNKYWGTSIYGQADRRSLRAPLNWRMTWARGCSGSGLRTTTITCPGRSNWRWRVTCAITRRPIPALPMTSSLKRLPPSSPCPTATSSIPTSCGSIRPSVWTCRITPGRRTGPCSVGSWPRPTGA